MANRPAPLKQNDLTRYAKAMRAAGFSVVRVELEPTGKVSIIGGSVANVAAGPDPSELLR